MVQIHRGAEEDYMKHLIIMLGLLIGGMVVASADPNPLLGWWHVTNGDPDMQVTILITPEEMLDGPDITTSHNYLLSGDVLKILGYTWLVNVKNANKIGLLGWVEDENGEPFPQLLILDRIVKDIPSS
jgi:hypothetical protein